MRFKIQVVVVSDDGEERQQEISSFERGEFNLTSLGLTMAESKAILKRFKNSWWRNKSRPIQRSSSDAQIAEGRGSARARTQSQSELCSER